MPINKGFRDPLHPNKFGLSPNKFGLSPNKFGLSPNKFGLYPNLTHAFGYNIIV